MTRETGVITPHAPKPPPDGNKRYRTNVRSVFVSDLHLGSKFARIDQLLAFLKQHRPEYLYLVGDIVDGWCLTRKWHWPENYNLLLDHFVELADTGTKIRFTPGNHDEFLRRFLLNNELVCIRNEFIHEGADGRRFVILHGDQFDDIEQHAKWLSMVGNIGYEVILRIDFYINAMVTRLGMPRRRISQDLKGRAKRVVQFISGFQARVVDHARDRGCDAVVCGHIHMPELAHHDDVLYVNLGDWVENSTALIEYDCGRLELYSADNDETLAETSRITCNDDKLAGDSWGHPHAPAQPWQPAVA